MNSPEGRDFERAAAMMCSWRHPLLVSHEKPDGDALGSLAAMRALLRTQGVGATALIFDPIPVRMEVFARRGATPLLLRSDEGRKILDAVDGVVILDTCTYTQLTPIAGWLRASGAPKVAIDHHRTRDEVADLQVIDESAAATCLILYDFARDVGWPVDAEAAEAMFIGIATDTGWFRHSNADARALAACADLAGRGVGPNELFQELYQRDSAGRVRLLGEALGSLELLGGGRLAVMTLSLGALERAGALLSDTEDIVNEPLRVATSVVSVLLVEQEDGLVRVNLRSRQPLAGRTAAGREAPVPDIDVAALAQAFGGGGHRRAAGARVPGELGGVRAVVVERILGLLGGSS